MDFVEKWPGAKVSLRPIEEVLPYAQNARTHSPAQVERIRKSMEEFGFTSPLLVDEKGVLIAGHGRLLAAKAQGFSEVPVMVAEGWSAAQVRAYRIADNQLTLLGGWDQELLAGEVGELSIDGFDLDLLGFSDKELDALFTLNDEDTIDEMEEAEPIKNPVTCLGDIWELGGHRVMCGSSIDNKSYHQLMGTELATVCLTDPPYGLGDSVTKKNNYASYDDSSENLDKLISSFLPIAKDLCDLCIITPGVGNLYRYPPPVWVMAWFTPAGVGTGPWGFCCWQPIICYGKDPKLAKGLGRNPDAFVMTESSFKSEHPCAKPVGVWSWLMKRVSERGETILDPFLGSGTTVIVAEKLGRRCFGLEIEPGYVDLCIRRWEDLTHKSAILVSDGRTFSEVRADREEK